MCVHLSQIRPGHVLLETVRGPSGKPIVPENTVLTDIHIDVMKRFLIQSVSITTHVSAENQQEEQKNSTLPESQASGKQQVVSSLPRSISSVDPTGSSLKKQPFETHYRAVVSEYGKHFKTWQNHVPIDLPTIRRLFIPLIERTDDISKVIYKLHLFSTRETYIYHHAVALGILASHLGRQMGYAKGEWLQIGLAGLLSDCGMARVNPAILTQTRPLSAKEFSLVKDHVEQGYRMVEKQITLSQGVKLAILQHHERPYATGYPFGALGPGVHKYARIIAVCDVYHAMTCERVYQEKTSPFKVMELLRREQFHNLDPTVIQTFLSGLQHVTTGTTVMLSNHRIGDIVFIASHDPSQVIIRMVDDHSFISLHHEVDLYISDIVE